MENKGSLRFILGILVIAGIPYEIVKERFGVCKSYYYSLREPAEKILEALFRDGEYPRKILIVTKHFVARCVMCLSLYCRAPIESIVLFFTLVIGMSVSKGSIGRIRKEAAEKAAALDAEISLAGIEEIATDEIFQQGKPVLTTIDLETDYVIMMEAAPDRSGETWEAKLQEPKSRGLQASLNVSDSGTGLLNGVQKAFPGIAMQPDAFHMLRDLGREVHRIEGYGYKKLSRYYELDRRVNSRKRGCASAELCKQYQELHNQIDSILQQADEILILYDWLREYTAFPGYGYQKSLCLCEWILDEMASRFPERQDFHKAVQRFRVHLPELLSFLLRLRDKIWKSAEDFPHVNGQDFLLLYKQEYCQPNSQAYDCMETRLYHRFGPLLPKAREVLEDLLRTTRRASSMIENLNGRLRCFMDLKREIPDQFLILIKVYFNTKKSLRSRRSNWKGTSALERLTKKHWPEFLDLVTAPLDYIF